MNSKWHLIVSIAKSTMRIMSAAIALQTQNWMILAWGFLIAEGLGIFEELGDKR